NNAQEAALKYFMLSIFSSAILLFGFSYLFGITGSTNLSVILHTLNQNLLHPEFPMGSAIAVVTIVCGLAFRITAVPFHFYAPDVYQGVANVNAALLAYIPKIAGVVALIRVLGFVLPATVIAPANTIGVGLSDQVPLLLWILAAITMFVGNLLALRQDHVRRILAYSSIAHAGYMLAALSAAPSLRRIPGSPDGVEAVLYYLVAYGAMTVGVFAVLAYLDSDERRIDTLDDIAGLSTEHPALAIALAIFIFSLIGIPFTAGFTGKFFILFSTLALQEQHATLYRVLALIIVLNAAIGGWYYLRIVAALYFRGALKPFPIVPRLPAIATIVICLTLTIGLSIPPGLIWMQRAIKLAAKNPAENAVANLP
ncbi:MAG: NADH-quinone oxidoreductase subunit N, partial [Planctomycetota bacterium]